MKTGIHLGLLLAAIAISALASLALLFALRAQSSAAAVALNPDNIAKAAVRYAQDCAARGQLHITRVTLDRLVNLGYLDNSDVKGFAGCAVMLRLDPAGTNPHPILVEARASDGTLHALFQDGSVQSLSAARYLEQTRQPPR